MTQPYHATSYPFNPPPEPEKPKPGGTRWLLPGTIIALTLISLLLVVFAAIQYRAKGEAEDRALDRSQTISNLRNEQEDLEADLEAVEEDLDEQRSRTNIAERDLATAEAQLDQLRQAGAGEELFWRTVQRGAPAMAIAGRDLSIQTGQAMCDALGRGATRADIEAIPSEFPPAQRQVFYDAAENFLC